jgi:hypothetical protein
VSIWGVERSETRADSHELKTEGMTLGAFAHRLLPMVGVSMARIFGGRWRCIKSLGEGGQSWVYIVEDTTGEFTGVYALKRLKRHDRAARFRNEVEILRRLDDDHIIKLVDAEVREDEGNDSSYLGSVPT